MGKKIWLSVVLLIVFIGIAGAVSNSCNSTNNIILSLSNNENAHGSIWSDSIYGYKICYEQIFGEIFPGSGDVHACNGKNALLSLSSETNAHAGEVGAYIINICYGDLNCALKNNSCEFWERKIVSLSNKTNAHLGVSGYGWNVCCAAPGIGVYTFDNKSLQELMNHIQKWVNGEVSLNSLMSAIQDWVSGESNAGGSDCIPEICDDGIDNDCDGLVDKDDEDCQVDYKVVPCKKEFNTGIILVAKDDSPDYNEYLNNLNKKMLVLEEVFNYALKDNLKYNFSLYSINITKNNKERALIREAIYQEPDPNKPGSGGNTIFYSLNITYIINEFYQNYPDYFDFLIVAYDVQGILPSEETSYFKGNYIGLMYYSGLAYFQYKNYISGTGRTLYNNLQDNGFESHNLLGITITNTGFAGEGEDYMLLHELMHNWAVYVGDLETDNTSNMPLLDFVHGCHYSKGVDFSDVIKYNSLGFTKINESSYIVNKPGYWPGTGKYKYVVSNLTLYFAGAMPKESVPDIEWLRFPIEQPLDPGTIITPSEIKIIKIEDIISRYGEIKCYGI